jgi:hypothetical protein
MNKFAISALIPKLKDEVLEHIAQKRNPLESPLALVELNRRQQMRLASAAPDAPSHGPTVFDSQMSRLAGTGLGRIAPNNVAVMAKGGLAALAEDDDDVPRYNGADESLVVTPENFGEIYARETDEMQLGRRTAYSTAVNEYMRKVAAEGSARRDSFAERERQRMLAGSKELARQYGAPPPAAPAVSGAYEDTARLAQRYPAPASTGGRPRGTPAPAPAGGRRPAGPALAPAAAPAAAAPVDYAKQFEAIRGSLDNPLTKEFENQRRLDQETAQGMRRAREEYSQTSKELIEEQRQRIRQQENDVVTQRNSNVALSLIQAGAAIATTPGPAMAAIARGMGVGAKQYESGLAELRRSQQLIEAARQRLAEARLGDARDKMNAEVEAQKMMADANRTYVQGIASVYQINTRVASDILKQQSDAEQNRLNIESRERIAREENAARLKAAGMGAAPRDAVSLLANSMNIPYHQAFQHMQTAEGRKAALKYLSDDWEKNAQQIRMKFPNIQSFADYAAAQGMPLAGGAAGSSLQFEGKLPK